MDLVLDDPLVSRQHAVIISRGSEFVLQDIGGRNPIKVNRKEVLSHVLSPGDLIEVGEPQATIADAAILEAIERNGREIALVLLSGVHYFSGQRFDLRAIAHAAHAQGAKVGFDLARLARS